LPNTKGAVKREPGRWTEADVERALDALPSRSPFTTVDRPIQAGDVAVINLYRRQRRPIPGGDRANAGRLAEQKRIFWVDVPSNRLSRLADQMRSEAGDRRTVTVDFPPDFMTPRAGRKKKAAYEVEVVEVKPSSSAAGRSFRKNLRAESLENCAPAWRRDSKTNYLSSRTRAFGINSSRPCSSGLILSSRPPPCAETRNVVYDIVHQNQKRGLSREMIEQQKDQIYSAAPRRKGRLKAAFLMQKIAEKEDVQSCRRRKSPIGSPTLRVFYQIPPDKFLKDLQKRNGLIENLHQIMNEKVLDFLQEECKD